MAGLPMVTSCSSQHHDIIIYLVWNDGAKMLSHSGGWETLGWQHFPRLANFRYRSVPSGRIIYLCLSTSYLGCFFLNWKHYEYDWLEVTFCWWTHIYYVKIKCSKFLVKTERSCHIDHRCKVLNPCLFCLVVMTIHKNIIEILLSRWNVFITCWWRYVIQMKHLVVMQMNNTMHNSCLL